MYMHSRGVLAKLPFIMMMFLAVMVANCGGGGGSSTPSATTVEVVSCNTVTPAVSVNATASNTFSPADVTIPVNGVVEWDSTSSVNHSVTSGDPGVADGKFNEILAPGASVCLKFTQAGTYNYYCIYHYSVGMVGSVTVQ